jgi:hypothetical protein
VIRRLPFAVALSFLVLALSACRPPPPASAAVAPLAVLAPIPADLAASLDAFRAEGPKGWAFTQATTGGGKDRVERYDPSRRGPARWTLLSEKGRAPAEAEQQRYRDTRPPFDAAANLAAQVDRASAALVARDERSATYEFALRPAGEHDTAAAHMRVRFTRDAASGAFTRVELFNFEPFKAATSLTIHEARTTLVYAPPADGRPALPLETSLRVRGTRFWVSNFSQDIVSKFSDHADMNAAPAGAASSPSAAGAHSSSP